jgi:transcriptional regulator with XRE-family HTH domain
LLNTYNSWDLQNPNIPKRSHLYQLTPIGIGTHFVESLTGYIARISESHNVLPSVLITREIASLAQTKFIKNITSRGLRSFFERATALNSTGDMAQDLVQALQLLTLRDDLHFLTFLFWAEIIPPRNLFRTKKAWCPICYEEWHLHKQIIYEPLLWTISSVQICPHHQKYLCHICYHCNQELPLLSWRSRPGYCSNCDSWLGVSLPAQQSSSIIDSPIISTEDLHWHSWVVESIGELISSAPSFESIPAKENIAKSFSLVIDMVTYGNAAEFARLMGIPKNTIWMWQKKKALPLIDMLLKICYRLEISLLDFLNAEQLCTKSLIKISHRHLKPSRISRTSPKLFDPNQVQDFLLTILASEEDPPPTMKEVAIRIGYDRRTIFNHFPDLCRSISSKCRIYNKACHIRKIEQLCKEVQEIVFKLHHQGEYPTEARVSELMSNPGYFRYNQIRTQLDKTRRELGL